MEEPEKAQEKRFDIGTGKTTFCVSLKFDSKSTKTLDDALKSLCSKEISTSGTSSFDGKN